MKHKYKPYPLPHSGKTNVYKNLYRIRQQVRYLREHNVTSDVLNIYLKALERAERDVRIVEERSGNAKKGQKKEP